MWVPEMEAQPDDTLDVTTSGDTPEGEPRRGVGERLRPSHFILPHHFLSGFIPPVPNEPHAGPPQEPPEASLPHFFLPEQAKSGGSRGGTPPSLSPHAEEEEAPDRPEAGWATAGERKKHGSSGPPPEHAGPPRDASPRLFAQGAVHTLQTGRNDALGAPGVVRQTGAVYTNQTGVPAPRVLSFSPPAGNLLPPSPAPSHSPALRISRGENERVPALD
ncbi:hypothetical protein T484DRAFT_1768648, partial [Baffinella frigidus]